MDYLLGPQSLRSWNWVQDTVLSQLGQTRAERAAVDHEEPQFPKADQRYSFCEVVQWSPFVQYKEKLWQKTRLKIV